MSRPPQHPPTTPAQPQPPQRSRHHLPRRTCPMPRRICWVDPANTDRWPTENRWANESVGGLTQQMTASPVVGRGRRPSSWWVDRPNAARPGGAEVRPGRGGWATDGRRRHGGHFVHRSAGRTPCGRLAGAQSDLADGRDLGRRPPYELQARWWRCRRPLRAGGVAELPVPGFFAVAALVGPVGVDPAEAASVCSIHWYCAVPKWSMPPQRSTARPQPWFDVPGRAARDGLRPYRETCERTSGRSR